MRIVLDTNVVLSAMLWRGTPYHLLVAVAQHPHAQLYASTALIDALADVLSRPAAAKRLALTGQSQSALLADYVEIVQIVEPTSVPRVVAGDIDDDQVIAAALAAQADFIVTGDRKHLLPLGSHQGVAIVDSSEALERLGQG